MSKFILAALLLVATSCVLVGAWKSKLFEELNNDSLTIEEIESILNSVDKTDSVKVGSVYVRDILAMKNVNLTDCVDIRLRMYLRFYSAVDHNKGAIKYLESKLSPLIELCVENLDAIKAELEVKFDGDYCDDINGLSYFLPKVGSIEELTYEESLDAVYEYINNQLDHRPVERKARRMRLIKACQVLISYVETPVLIVSEAKKRNIPAESLKNTSWDLDIATCKNLIYEEIEWQSKRG